MFKARSLQQKFSIYARHASMLHLCSTKGYLRNNAGASLALVAICAFAIVLFIVLCFQLIMVFGGMQELNSTADAAALNIATRAMEIKTKPTPQFSDCADSQGGISLANINRVWGKAYLINANVEEMTANQLVTAKASNAADNVFSDAQTINDNLNVLLKDNLTLGSLFDQIAGLRLHRMLGKQVGSDVNSNWNTALAYRGDQSNLSVNFNQIPTPSNSRVNVIGAGSTSYMPGYTPIQANDKNFYFVSFHNAETPHLITESFFQHNRPELAGLGNISNPLPNAFSGHGIAGNSLAAQSFAAANPQRQYNLAIPHAFVTVSVVNLAYWFVQGQQINVTNYGFTPEKQFGAQNIPLPNPLSKLPKMDYLDGYASLGNEFQSNPTLLSIISSVQSDLSQDLANIVQRIQEVKPDFTQSNLEQLLQQQLVLPGVNTYFIYPTYTSPDNTNPNIKICPANAQAQKTLPNWLSMTAITDGQNKVISTKSPVQDDPNYDWEMVYGSHFQAGAHWTENTSNISWTPGSGANQSLGKLMVVHITNCYFTATPI